jgi:hypothetical protein
MIPVVTDPVEVERAEHLQRGRPAEEPAAGARVRNTTGKHLLQGPGHGAGRRRLRGDARIDDVRPGRSG